MVFCDIINKDLLEGVCKNMGKITKKTANRAKKTSYMKKQYPYMIGGNNND